MDIDKIYQEGLKNIGRLPTSESRAEFQKLLAKKRKRRIFLIIFVNLLVLGIVVPQIDFGSQKVEIDRIKNEPSKSQSNEFNQNGEEVSNKYIEAETTDLNKAPTGKPVTQESNTLITSHLVDTPNSRVLRIRLNLNLVKLKLKPVNIGYTLSLVLPRAKGIKLSPPPSGNVKLKSPRSKQTEGNYFIDFSFGNSVALFKIIDVNKVTYDLNNQSVSLDVEYEIGFWKISSGLDYSFNRLKSFHDFIDVIPETKERYRHIVTETNELAYFGIPIRVGLSKNVKTLSFYLTTGLRYDYLIRSTGEVFDYTSEPKTYSLKNDPKATSSSILNYSIKAGIFYNYERFRSGISYNFMQSLNTNIKPINLKLNNHGLKFSIGYQIW